MKPLNLSTYFSNEFPLVLGNLFNGGIAYLKQGFEKVSSLAKQVFVDLYDLYQQKYVFTEEDIALIRANHAALNLAKKNLPLNVLQAIQPEVEILRTNVPTPQEVTEDAVKQELRKVVPSILVHLSHINSKDGLSQLAQQFISQMLLTFVIDTRQDIVLLSGLANFLLSTKSTEGHLVILQSLLADLSEEALKNSLREVPSEEAITILADLQMLKSDTTTQIEALNLLETLRTNPHYKHVVRNLTNEAAPEKILHHKDKIAKAIPLLVNDLFVDFNENAEQISILNASFSDKVTTIFGEILTDRLVEVLEGIHLREGFDAITGDLLAHVDQVISAKKTVQSDPTKDIYDEFIKRPRGTHSLTRNMVVASSQNGAEEKIGDLQQKYCEEITEKLIDLLITEKTCENIVNALLENKAALILASSNNSWVISFFTFLENHRRFVPVLVPILREILKSSYVKDLITNKLVPLLFEKFNQPAKIEQILTDNLFPVITRQVEKTFIRSVLKSQLKENNSNLIKQGFYQLLTAQNEDKEARKKDLAKILENHYRSSLNFFRKGEETEDKELTEIVLLCIEGLESRIGIPESEEKMAEELISIINEMAKEKPGSKEGEIGNYYKLVQKVVFEMGKIVPEGTWSGVAVKLALQNETFQTTIAENIVEALDDYRVSPTGHLEILKDLLPVLNDLNNEGKLKAILEDQSGPIADEARLAQLQFQTEKLARLLHDLLSHQIGNSYLGAGQAIFTSLLGKDEKHLASTLQRIVSELTGDPLFTNNILALVFDQLLNRAAKRA